MSRIMYGNQLSCDQSVQGGALCLQGTRFTVSTILRWLAERRHPELEKAYNQNLPPSTIRMALLELAGVCDDWPMEVREAADRLEEDEHA